MKPLRHPAAPGPGHLWFRPGSTWSSVVRARLKRSRPAPGQGPGQGVVPPAPRSGCQTHGHTRDLSGSQVTFPYLCPALRPRPNTVGLAMTVPDAAPGTTQRRLQRLHDFEASPQSFSTRCLRFTTAVAGAHARLASGWRAPPLPGGRQTLWITIKGFRSYPSSFPGLTLTQGWSMPSARSAGHRPCWPTCRATPIVSPSRIAV